MDIPRQKPKRKSRPLWIGAIAMAALIATLGLSKLQPAAPP